MHGRGAVLRRQRLRTLEGAIGHDSRVHAFLLERGQRELRHLPGTHHHGATSRERSEDLLGELHGRRAHTQHTVTQPCLAPDPPSREERTLEEPIQNRAGFGPAPFPRIADLAMNLRLAHDHGLHARRNAEEMHRRSTVPPDVAVTARVASQPFRQHLPRRRGRFPLPLNEIELRAIAGGEQHAFTRTRRVAHARQRRQDIARREGEPLAHIERRAVMAHTEHDHGHSAIRAESCPRSIASQNSASISSGDFSRQRCTSPAAIMRLRSALRSLSASP